MYWFDGLGWTQPMGVPRVPFQGRGAEMMPPMRASFWVESGDAPMVFYSLIWLGSHQPRHGCEWCARGLSVEDSWGVL